MNVWAVTVAASTTAWIIIIALMLRGRRHGDTDTDMQRLSNQINAAMRACRRDGCGHAAAYHEHHHAATYCSREHCTCRRFTP